MSQYNGRKKAEGGYYASSDEEGLPPRPSQRRSSNYRSSAPYHSDEEFARQSHNNRSSTGSTFEGYSRGPRQPQYSSSYSSRDQSRYNSYFSHGQSQHQSSSGRTYAPPSDPQVIYGEVEDADDIEAAAKKSFQATSVVVDQYGNELYQIEDVDELEEMKNKPSSKRQTQGFNASSRGQQASGRDSSYRASSYYSSQRPTTSQQSYARGQDQGSSSRSQVPRSQPRQSSSSRQFQESNQRQYYSSRQSKGSNSQPSRSEDPPTEEELAFLASLRERGRMAWASGKTPADVRNRMRRPDKRGD